MSETIEVGFCPTCGGPAQFIAPEHVDPSDTFVRVGADGAGLRSVRRPATNETQMQHTPGPEPDGWIVRAAWNTAEYVVRSRGAMESSLKAGHTCTPYWLAPSAAAPESGAHER